ncbi:hypothetical protein [Flavitalea sp.]|nr:hypothetical protein [Flavitalea sp.]
MKMENKWYYNNPVFTMPDKNPTKSALGSAPTGKFLKGKAGSYDESLFSDASTGEFCFPDYNAGWKGVVKLKDHTKYKQGSSIEEFEYYFFSPAIEVPDFETFLEQLPGDYFPVNTSGGKLFELFEEYQDFVQGHVKASYYFEQFRDPSELVQAALFYKVDNSALKPADLWEEIAPVKVDEICIANNIRPVKNNEANIKKLVENNIPFPYEFYRPTDLLKEIYKRFTILYVEDIKVNTDHFHPLYLQPLWEEVERSCGNEDIEEQVNAILKSKFWKQRLI